MERIRTTLGASNERAQEIYALWIEYEEAATAEALFVKDLDKFEMIVQALEYEKSDGRRLDSFFDSTIGRFQHPQVKRWVEALLAERAQLHDAPTADA